MNLLGSLKGVWSGRGGDGTEMRVEEYDSLMMSCAEEMLQRTFKKRNTRKVKVSEPVWITEPTW